MIKKEEGQEGRENERLGWGGWMQGAVFGADIIIYMSRRTTNNKLEIVK